jgi:hypothetical protein
MLFGRSSGGFSPIAVARPTTTKCGCTKRKISPSEDPQRRVLGSQKLLFRYCVSEEQSLNPPDPHEVLGSLWVVCRLSNSRRFYRSSKKLESVYHPKLPLRMRDRPGWLFQVAKGGILLGSSISESRDLAALPKVSNRVCSVRPVLKQVGRRLRIEERR